MKNSPNEPTRQRKNNLMTVILNSKLGVSLTLLVLALLARLPDLGRFLTPDEFLWIDRSRNFLAGLTNPAYQCVSRVEQWEHTAEGLACTLRTGHPGVTTMWTGSFGFLLRWLADGRPVPFHDYVVAVSTNPLDAAFIAPERLGTVLIISLWVVAVYWLVRRLFGSPIALATAILIALNPFHIAYSRVIHHDALSTAFMTLSALCAFVYWGEQSGRKWLVTSGVLAGLAFISKLASLFLMPYIALVGLWFFVAGWQRDRQSDKKRASFSNFLFLILDGLLWFAMAMSTVFLVWPAMWVAPLETVQLTVSLAVQYSTGPHAKGVFFLGQSVADPGPLFYLVTWLYHTSPLVMLGLVGLVFALFHYRGAKPAPPQSPANQPALNNNSPFTIHYSSFFRYLPLILFFILGYYVLMTIGEKKQERYFLPAYPWLDLIAAVGLVSLLDYPFIPRLIHRVSRLALLLLTILIVNGLLVASNFPYYLTYYNPLLGGIKSAAKVITIGWGEGLNLAAEYLNQKTDPAQTRVASWYESTFAPFYHGPSISYSKEKGKALAGDYVIFYINQTQRRFPDEIMFDYFETRFKPEKVITLHGLDYAWIYPSLGVDHYIQDQTYTGIASLLAWQWANGDDVPLIPGQPANFELYWEYLGKELDETFFFRLVDAGGHIWAEGESQPVAAENPPIEQWREGEIIFERGSLTLPVDIPPGQYQLQIGFYTKAPAVTEGELLFVVPDDEVLVIVGHANHSVSYALPPTATPIDQSLGNGLTLLGVTGPGHSLVPESTLFLDLYWRVEQPLTADAGLHLGLIDEAEVAKQAWFDLSLAETFSPTETTWQPGDIIHTRWQLDLLPQVGPGGYHFEVVLAEDITQILPFGRLEIRE
jgi:hypothetical protein